MGLHKAAGNSNTRQCWALAAAVGAVAIALEIGGDPAREALAYTRDGVAGGELWRLLSNHFVHLGWTHLWLNLAGLALVWHMGIPISRSDMTCDLAFKVNHDLEG